MVLYPLRIIFYIWYQNMNYQVVKSVLAELKLKLKTNWLLWL